MAYDPWSPQGDPIKTQPSSYSSGPMASGGAMPVAAGSGFDPWSPQGEADPNSLAGASGNENYWSPVDKMAGQTGNEDYWSPMIYKSQDGSFKANEGQGKPEINDNVNFDINNWMKEVDAQWNKSRQEEDSRAQMFQNQENSRLAGITAEEKRKAGEDKYGGSSGAGGRSSGMGGGSIYQGPVYDYPEYNSPEPFEYGATLDLPDYKPPEYDEDKEKAVREEFIQTNKGSMSKLAQQAILGSSNVNNPQARGQIIKAALEGFGESLGQTALKGSEAGRRAAEKQQATETGIYQAKFQIESKEAMAKYDADMKADLMNWELGVKQADRDYTNQLSQWNSMPNDAKAESMPGYNKTAGPPTGRRYF